MRGWSLMSCTDGSLPCLEAKSRSQDLMSARTRSRLDMVVVVVGVAK